MRTIIIFAVLIASSIFSTTASANGYCNSRPSYQERQRCYNNMSGNTLTSRLMAKNFAQLQKQMIAKNKAEAARRKALAAKR